jgi:hypothetical protein
MHVEALEGVGMWLYPIARRARTSARRIVQVHVAVHADDHVNGIARFQAFAAREGVRRVQRAALRELLAPRLTYGPQYSQPVPLQQDRGP